LVEIGWWVVLSGRIVIREHQPVPGVNQDHEVDEFVSLCRCEMFVHHSEELIRQAARPRKAKPVSELQSDQVSICVEGRILSRRQADRSLLCLTQCQHIEAVEVETAGATIDDRSPNLDHLPQHPVDGCGVFRVLLKANVALIPSGKVDPSWSRL